MTQVKLCSSLFDVDLLVDAGLGQRDAQRDHEDDGCDDCGDDIDAGGYHLGGAGDDGGGEVTSRKHERDDALADVQYEVAQRAGGSTDDVEGEVRALASAEMGDKSADKAHHEEEDEGKRCGRNVGRIEQVKEHRADSGSETTAQSAEEQSGEQAEDVADLDVGRACRGGDLDSQEVGRNKADSGHQTDDDDVVQTELRGVVFCCGRLITHCGYLQ